MCVFEQKNAVLRNNFFSIAELRNKKLYNIHTSKTNKTTHNLPKIKVGKFN